MNSSKDASDIGDLLPFRKDTFRLFPRAGRGAVASWPFVRKSRQNWTNSRNGGQVIFRPAPKIAGPCNPCFSHDLRHSDRSALVGRCLHHAHGRIPGRICGVRRTSCRLEESEFQCAFPAHFGLRGEFNARSFSSDPNRAGSTGSPQGPSRCAPREARNLHHGAHSHDRRFDRSGSGCGIRHYLKQGT